MKKSILMLFTVILTALTLSSFRPTNNVKIIAVVNKADWCSICKAYAGRTVEIFNKNNEDGYFQFIVNDITNDATKKASAPAVKQAGLTNQQSNVYAAGVITFYDAKTKKVLAQATVANTTEEIAGVMKMVREKASK